MQGQREEIKVPGGQSFRVLRWMRNLREAESLLADGKVERIVGEGAHWHFHAEMELTLFTRGAGTRFVGDSIAPFAAGDLVLLGGNLPHYWHARGPCAGYSIQWNFAATHPVWSLPETEALAPLFRTAERGLHFTGEVLASAERELPRLGEASGVRRLATFLELLATLAAAPVRSRALLSSRAFSLPGEHTHQQAIAGAVRYLLANFREPIRLEALLKLTHMSKATFARQFRRHSGKTFSEFVTQIRLQAACHDLRTSDRTVLDIALSSGFSQVSFFNRIFRRLMQCSPAEYRARAHGE